MIQLNKCVQSRDSPEIVISYRLQALFGRLNSGVESYVGARVLVIDDDPIVCATAQHVLRRAAHEVQIASRFSEAFALAERQQFDVLVTDLVMPDVDGTTVIRRFKDRFPEMPIVAMSGGARIGTSDTLALAKEAGADELLHKPFSTDSIVASINAALEKRVKSERRGPGQ